MHSFSVEVKNLGKRYGSNRIFDGISFAHTQGVLGIAGSNGSGKSTLLQCLSGLERATSGRVEWSKGDEIIERSALKKHLGYAAPYINLYEEFSCAENIDFLLKLRGVKNRDSIVKNALAEAGIGAHASQPYGNLSTGQQQRLRLASALAHAPEVLFLDEPGSNLDEKGRALIERIVAENRRNSLVVIASNNPDELALCDRVYSVEGEEFM